MTRENPGAQPEAQDQRDSSDMRISPLDGAGAVAHDRAWRWGLRLGGGVALLTLLAVAGVALIPLIPRPPTAKSPPPPSPKLVALQVPTTARGCISGAAWSPDGAQVALVRDSLCDPHATDPNDPSALVFDATTGKLVNSFPLVRMIVPAGAPPGAQVALGGVIWTPHGDQIAALYAILEPGPSQNIRVSAEGVALLTVRGAGVGAVASEQDTPFSSAFADPLPLTEPQKVAVWGIPTGAQPGFPARIQLTLPSAYAYHWGPNGALTPATLSGNHSTDHATISLWDSGLLWLVNATTCANGQTAMLPNPYLALALSTVAWSPDGARLVSLGVTGAYPLAASAPTPTASVTPISCSQGPATEDVPPGPIPDGGLRAVLERLATESDASVRLAWRHDGARLAAFTFTGTGDGSLILIYDCHTGKLLRRYTTSQIPINGQPGTGPAKNFSIVFTGGVWSPNGRRLLVEAIGEGALPFILGSRDVGA